MVARMCCRTGCLLLVPHNSFYNQHSLEMVRSMLVWDGLWKETEICKLICMSVLCTGWRSASANKTKYELSALCKKGGGKLVSEGAITKSHLSVQDGEGRKHLVILKDGWIETKGEECSTALPLGISTGFFSIISINLGCLCHLFVPSSVIWLKKWPAKQHSLSWTLCERSLQEESLQIPHPNITGLWCWKKSCHPVY